VNGSVIRPSVLLLILLTLTWGVARAGFIEVEPIEQDYADASAYDQVITEIKVEGNKHTREWVILQAIFSQVGMTYTHELAKQDLLYLLRIGSFTSVFFTHEQVDDGIVLIIHVVEATPYIPSLSFALTQENGVEIGPAFSSSNLLGYGARASVYARFGGATNIGLKYADPQLMKNNWNIGYKFEYFHRERTNKLLDFGEITDEFFLEYKHRINGDISLGPRFRYMYLKSDKDGITLSESNKDNVPSLGFFMEYDTRNGIYPTNGWYLDCEASKYGMFGTDTDFWRLDLDTRRYVRLPFAGNTHSLAIYSYLTMTNGVIDETLPSHQLFFIGGTNSVRGWSLASRNGRRQWLGTVEYWYELMEQRKWKLWFIKIRMGFSLGAFADIGSAWNNQDEFTENMIGGGGVGFRLTLPVVTVIRFDMAMGEEGYSVRFFIGGNEKAAAQKFRVR